MSLEQSIKNHARKIGIDLCGIAPVSRFENAPEGTRPADYLPGCKSVVVVGLRLLDGAIQSIFRNFEDGDKFNYQGFYGSSYGNTAQGIYGTYGYTIAPNFHILFSVYSIARFIEDKTGLAATPTQVGPFANGGISISQRHAAVAAGLGEFGWLGIVLSPQFGPRNRFGTVLTTADLQPDPMYTGPRLCNPDKCRICTTVCPTGALSKYGEQEANHVVYKDKDGDREYDYCKINRPKCMIGGHGLMIKTGGTRDLVSSIDAPASEVYSALKKTDSEGGLQSSPSWKCGKCLAYCPAGNWKKKFKDTRLSNRLPIVKW